MLIRCPECSFTRQINDSKVPAGSEYATCPKCKQRFRFRTLSPEEIESAQAAQAAQSTQSAQSEPSAMGDDGQPIQSGHAAYSAEQPEAHNAGEQEPFSTAAHDESAPATQTERQPEEHGDVWSAVENLNRRWDEDSPEDNAMTGDEPDDAGTFGAYGTKDHRFSDELESLSADDDPEDTDLRGQAGYSDYDEDGPQSGAYGAPGSSAPHGPYGSQKFPGHQPDDEMPGNGQGKPSFLADSGSVPWEYRGGFLNPQALARTVLLSFTRIPEFFGGIPNRGSLLPAMIFALLMRGLQFIVTFVFVKFDFVTQEGERINTNLAGIAQISIPELVVITLFIVVLLQFASSWVVNFMVRLVAGRSSFGLTFRVVAYSLAPLVFALLPQIGMMIGEVGSLALFTLGLRHAYRLSWQKTMMVMIPLMLLMFLMNLSTLKILAA
ncbi:zinc-ribbon domain-containing protein [Desulfovibrio sp. OttesenSCG-928-C06]|nr:zinc-ribbon domain-containing protein [Desulfovibrio sp. OttesenSCG-928-C06]